jgi:2-polyprenyl-3-methyl-5-hydroxy-6-metoxy-1,4-benzoquinol methylase
MNADRKTWPRGSQEARVETFYGRGVENYGDYHRGYLNVGLWQNGNTDCVTAAEHLVGTMGKIGGLNADSHLLDVACGMGPQDVFFARQFGCKIEAIDVTWKHVLHARRRARDAGLSSVITVHHETAVHLPFVEKTFTQVVCIEGGEHFNTREMFLQEAHRVLKSGGSIVMSDYALTREPKTSLERFVVEAARSLWHVPLENYETLETFPLTMERCGFTNVTLRPIGAESVPGYYVETRRPENEAAQVKIRGWVITKLGFFVDYAVYRAFMDGLIEYVLVSATKA